MSLQNARHSSRADYDWREFALLVRSRLAEDGRGYRALTDEIGVTFTDLSRAASGQMIAVHKVIAICDWMKVAVRAFYQRPTGGASMNSNRCSGSTVKHAGVERAADIERAEP